MKDQRLSVGMVHIRIVGKTPLVLWKFRFPVFGPHPPVDSGVISRVEFYRPYFEARQDEAGPGRTGRARHGVTRPGEARRGTAGRGAARQAR